LLRGKLRRGIVLVGLRTDLRAAGSGVIATLVPGEIDHALGGNSSSACSLDSAAIIVVLELDLAGRVVCGKSRGPLDLGGETVARVVVARVRLYAGESGAREEWRE
jgi:hypothetical protein